ATPSRRWCSTGSGSSDRRVAVCHCKEIALCELVWVLETTYGYPREQVALALDSIRRTRQFVIEDAQEANSALDAYRNGGDFADALLAAANIGHGCAHTMTFDQKAPHRADSSAFRAGSPVE
ncbi:MAG: hypothetical protein ACREFC_11820, partial [Stellaceae bacterium]